MVRETRHLWVGNLPEHVREEKIVEHFKRYGRVESVKVLRKRGSEGGVAAFVDFVDIKSAQKAHNAVNKMGDRDLRTDYNEPGSVPSAVRGLEDNPPSSSHGRDVAGFSRGAVGPVFGPPVSLHSREGRYERRLDGTSDSRERAYDHSPYGHHERGGTFDRQRHYNADYYRDRSMFAAGPGPGGTAISASFDTPEPHFEPRIRDPFTMTSGSRRDLYREDRGRRVDRTYHHRRSRSSHSSQSRHPSPQRTTGQTPKAPNSPKRAPLSPGRAPHSRSHSRSSSSDSVSSTSSTGSGSSDSNSSSSDGSRARSVQSSATHGPPSQPSMGLDTDEPRRSFGIRVQNLPVRSTDTSLKDGLFHEFKKHGKVTSVQIHGASEERYGLVFFRQQEDQEKALTVSKGKLFFGMLIEVTAWNGPETESENEFRPLDGRIDEFHPKATRTLFIGNLEKTTSYQQLLDIFQRFGEIVDIDIKKVNGVPQYAFVQYSDIASVCKAIKKMDGEYLGSNRLKLGFGKSMPTTCVWLDGLASNITDQYLTRHFCRYGHVVKVVFDRLKGMALVLYNNTDFAQAAVRETKGWKIGGNKIKVDFASQESQMAFYRSMQASGQDIREIRDIYEIPTERREERRPPYHEFTAERAYYENVRTPGVYPEDPRRDYPARSRERFTELEHYQGDHFDPRFHEDPREYRDYRDPFEQDIRKYTYIQRERERERERFEADRGRWSPSHGRRPITPAVSPSPSERAPRDSERRVYSQSSERSGSCSSLSPPHFDKADKTPLEHGAKTDRLDKDTQLPPAERGPGAEKSKRGRRKEKADKEKGEKIKLRKGKVQSPSVPPTETELETSLEAGFGRGKVSDQDSIERQRYKGDSDPSTNQTASTSRHDPLKSERLDVVKAEGVEVDGKSRSKKHQKGDVGNDGKDVSVDSDRLAARKRRFGDASGKTIRQKRSRLEDEDGNQIQDFGPSTAVESDSKLKDPQRRDSRSKTERMVFLSSHKEGQDSGARGQGEPSEGPIDPVDLNRLPGNITSRRYSHEDSVDQDTKDQEQHAIFKYGPPTTDNDKSGKEREEHVDIDLSQSYRKQMEQNRRLHQQLQESDKSEKPGSPLGVETDDLEPRSLVHEVGKPPQDVTDNFPSHKLKKLDQFDMQDASSKRERVYRRQKSEDPEWNSTASLGLQHFSHHADDEFADFSNLREVKAEDKVHPELELADKRTHTTQISKPSTPLHGSDEDQQKRWESRVKQDLLPDLNFSRSLGKNLHNRKRLEYGIGHDLEPGEVRSDSEEDRENKPHSPMPSTSVPFSERPRGDRFSDPKLATLERNKFYSFALDQTITPDTKALLERAKCLSSSREDNWSFLDYDSHFAGLRSQKDIEKVEPTPRPTPSWYMKKKKIRSGSEDKVDDRKEEPKPEEHERRELFASRFLHSSIFEQDSRRLQHLERRHEDPEHGQSQQTGQQGTTDTQPDSEPVVLFHSRFLELTRLQQQKGKDQLQQEVKRGNLVDENKTEKPIDQEPQPLQVPKVAEPPLEPDIKPVSPAEERISSESPLVLNLGISLAPKEMSPQDEKRVIRSPSPDIIPVSMVTEENKYNKQQSSTPPYPQVEIPPPAAEGVVAPEPAPPPGKFKSSPSEEKSEDVTPVVKSMVESSCDIDGGTQEASVSGSEPELEPGLEQATSELTELKVPSLPDTAEEMDVSKFEESYTAKTETLSDTENKLDQDKVPVYVEASEEPVSPPQKTKNKKSKSSPIQVAPASFTSVSSTEKPVTRKSERIDKEKLKRASSPRGESSKISSDCKSTAKSPIHGADSEQGSEQSISTGRARRRNVKSVYATPLDDETRTGKDASESPRSARKRGGDKDAPPQQNEEQDSLVPNTSKRGRPPKNRRQGYDASRKGDRSKMDTKDIDSNESESGEKIPKASKGRHSPYAYKGSGQVAQSGSSKGEKSDIPDDVQQQTDISEDDSLAPQDPLVSKDNSSLHDVTKKEEKIKQLVTDKRDQDKDKNNPPEDEAFESVSSEKGVEALVIDEQPSLEDKKTARGKSAKLTRTPKSPVLKNLKIRLNVTEVKDLLQLGDDEAGNQEDYLKKTKPSDSNDQLLECSQSKEESPSNENNEEEMPDAQPPLDPSQELELVQAVENIAKLTGPTLPTDPQPPTPPVPATEVKCDTEEEKPNNPASENELMAAIDSITAEEATVPLAQDPVIAPAAVESDTEINAFIQPVKGIEPTIQTSSSQGEAPFPNTPKKNLKGRAKTPKRPKSQKPSKKEPSKESLSEPESSSIATSDSTSSNTQTIVECHSSSAGVITATSWKPEPEPLVAKVADGTAESKVLPVEPPQHIKPVYPSTKSPNCPKPQQPPPECISPSLSPPPSRPSVRPLQPSRIPVSPPDWRSQSKDTGFQSAVLPGPFENQSPPSDHESLDPDHNTSDLRRILIKNKNVSLPGISSLSGNLAIPTPNNPHISENTPLVAVPNKIPLSESRPPPHPAQPIVRPPASLPSPETKSVVSVIASTATVISRVCNPPDLEEKGNATGANPGMEMQLPKPTYRSSMEDGGSYHGPSVGEEGGSAGRFLVESSTLSTGSNPGLRVNTSEGVVVLSHSGQKREGPLRLFAKISQIPPATAVDMESQQLVSMPQIKQEMYTHPQSSNPKCPPTSADHGHPAKTQQAVSSIKQENTGLEKMESHYQPGTQGGVVKRLPQAVGGQQVIGYHHSDFTMLLKHPKKVEGADALNSDGGKLSWTSAISPAISPHLPSPAGNHVGFVSATAGDRTPSHLSGVKQEPRSPRKSAHPHSPFSSQIGSSSPKGIPVMLTSGLPTMQQYVTSVHHPEQSVIMPPHSAHGALGRMSPHRGAQTIPMAHLVQGEVRVNTPPLSAMNFGIHGEPHASPWSGPMQQRPPSPQTVGRDMVLKVNPGTVRSHEGEQEDPRRFHPAAGRPSATQVKPETMQPDPRSALRSGIQMDQYITSPRDVRVLMHHPQGERAGPEPHTGGHIQETLPPSSTSSSIASSMSPRAHLLSKGVSEKDGPKPQEAKRPHSPSKDGMMGVRTPVSAIASPQRVQLMASGTGSSFPEYSTIYSNTRGIHSQVTESSTVGIQAPVNITSALGGEHSQAQTGHQPVNMVQLLTKYPIVWQGLLALKNDTAAVQLHFVCGNKALAVRSLPQPLPEGGQLLRIVQRMRLEASQLEGVARRMTGESEFCLLLALPCGRDQDDVLNQTQTLKAAFINYLQAKLAAGIINVPNPGSNQPAYVLQIFPPCEFSESHLSRLAPDLLNRISSISPHLMIVITTV
ncbi:msx2-interacting protein isoform X1 [Hypomesus transpacificus]|uniref:msx2-interacting protein isoform X1 n=2 Tax=Hypomesus transpacificus TaxID=137520 RepID=UPI001F07761E|nr:msx2-interacting protein isoform X1 [Hypomesus transpacificus]